MLLDVKIFNLVAFGFPNLQIENFNSQGPCSWMLIASILMFLDTQTAKSKILTSWGHVPGSYNFQFKCF